jgi:hypothetical protein
MATKPEDWNFPGGVDCAVCGQRVEVRAFRAIEQEARGEKPETILGAGEAGCYYHPQNRAAVACDACGRFLCALCDLPLDGQHLCPQCVETGVKTNKLAAADTHRTYQDSVALAFATWPMLIFYFTIFTAPVALYYVIRYWKQPQGILPRSKIRFVIAGVLALLQIGGWIAIIVAVALSFLRGTEAVG